MKSKLRRFCPGRNPPFLNGRRGLQCEQSGVRHLAPIDIVVHNLGYVDRNRKTYELLPPFLNGAVNDVQSDDAATVRHSFIWPLWLKQEIKMERSRPSPTVTIRAANQTDLPRLKIMVEALARHHDDVPQITAEILERDIFGFVPWIYVIIAEVGGRAVGYAALCPLIKLQVGIRGIDMHHLFVEADFRGSGIGKQLIEGAMQKARELSCSQMSVGTHPDNLSAQAVYLACGFERRDASNPRFRIAL